MDVFDWRPWGVKGRMLLAACLTVVGLVVLYPLSRANYLLFHAISESFSVIVAAGIFIIAWNTRRISDNRYLLNLGIAHLFVSLVSLLHAFAYKGMGIFPGSGANLPTQLWIISRTLEAAAFVVAGLSLRRDIPVLVNFAGFGALTALALASVFVVPVFPAMYVEGVGLTPVKVAMEYVDMALFAVAFGLLWRDRKRFEPSIAHTMLAAIGLMTAAGLAFTLYVDVYGVLNFLGHYLVLIGFVMVYRALIRTTLQEPYSSLFLELKRREESEHKIAEVLQTAILSAPGRIAGMDIGHVHVSATRTARVGGDFWDLFTTSDGKAAFVLGDVCGKGIDAATATVTARTTIRSYAYTDPDPSAVLSAANELLATQLADDKFVTVVYGVLDTETGSLQIASAGHPDPVVCTSGTSSCLELPRNPPLGVIDGHEFEAATWSMSVGDQIALFSDGLVEAGAKTEMLGVERVVRHLSTRCAEKPAAIAQSLLDSAVAHCGGTIDDDVAVLVLRRAHT